MPGFTEHWVLQEWRKIRLGRRVGNDKVLGASGGGSPEDKKTEPCSKCRRVKVMGGLVREERPLG